jgi:hypothetical protein
MAEKELTAEQRKVLDEVEASLSDAIGAGRRRLRDAGLIPDSEPHLECLACGCDHFEFGRPDGKCANPACRHPFSSHNLPE